MDTNTDNEIKVEIATDDKGNLNPVDRELAAGTAALLKKAKKVANASVAKTISWEKACKKVSASKGALTFVKQGMKLYLVRKNPKASRKRTFLEVTGHEIVNILNEAYRRAQNTIIEEAKKETGVPLDTGVPPREVDPVITPLVIEPGLTKSEQISKDVADWRAEVPAEDVTPKKVQADAQDFLKEWDKNPIITSQDPNENPYITPTSNPPTQCTE